jgi:ligand-binding sensor domain-containing protein
MGSPKLVRPIPALALELWVALASVPAAGSDIRARGVPSIRLFSADDGIPQSSINAVAFAPDGLLWIGTQGGPAFYDGRRFTPVSLLTSETSSWVQAITATHDGAVWLGMSAGRILRYANGTFTAFGADEGLTGEKPIRTLAEAPLGNGFALWAGRVDGLYRLEGARWTRVELWPGIENLDVHALSAGTRSTGEPTLWVGTNHGLLHCEDRRCAPLETGVIRLEELDAPRH